MTLPRAVHRLALPVARQAEPAAPAPAVGSAWDPEPGAPDEAVRSLMRPDPLDEAMRRQEIQGCKQLLIEIIRRAAHDWVLYRGHTRLLNRALADSAYRWLFVETRGTADWAERVREGKQATSFEAICESLDLDVGRVRAYVRRLTPEHVTGGARPAEYRRKNPRAEGDEDVYALPGGLVALDDVDDGTTL